MIGYLKGAVQEKSPPKLLLTLSTGLGYEVETPLSTFDIVEKDQIIGLYTHLIPREDALLLYGFLHTRERDLFRNLIKVNNVGPKLALSILSHMSTPDFTHCISTQDHARLTRIPGLGKKTAERLVIEMKDRLSKILSFTDQGTSFASVAQEEALNALVALGYKLQEAFKLLSQIKTPCETPEAYIRAALKERAA